MKNELHGRQKTAGLLAILGYLVSGVLLLIWPHLMTTVTMWVLVIVLFACGIFQLIRYFRLSPEDGASGYSLATALLVLTIGIFLLANPSLFASILPRVWGILLLLGGFVKIQDGFDAFRMRSGRWWLLLIGAALSIVLGVIAITRPAAVLDGVAVYIGITLILEAVIDCVMLILIRRFSKQA